MCGVYMESSLAKELGAGIAQSRGEVLEPGG